MAVESALTEELVPEGNHEWSSEEMSTAVESATPPAPEEADSEPPELQVNSLREAVRGAGACIFSMIVHLVGLLVLSLCVFSEQIQQELEAIVATVTERDEQMDIQYGLGYLEGNISVDQVSLVENPTFKK